MTDLETNNAWKPTASIRTLRERARLMQEIRNFFTARGYWEVETPIMAKYGITDVYLRNMHTLFREQTYCLQTSPEYHMKRLLAAESGAIFQLARVFRDDELGRWHNPEFTLLEWYQLDINHHQLMTEVDALLQAILQCPPLQKITYRQAFLETCVLDPLQASLPELRHGLHQFGLQDVLPEAETDRDQFLFLLMSHVVEPALAKKNVPIAVYDFPVSQAALAQSDGNVAARFEVYYRGVELANGFHELTDAWQQEARFTADNQQRALHGVAPADIDVYFLAALKEGVPACSGVALGIDRLFALALNQRSIAECMAFDISRA